ncbi:hypothetical protein [Corynebacterium sp. UMB10321]|uniref:hypothetical protein n=1 Tax=Corynebacterium sp. UMB10321 TaxID=3046312 RepID=UPI00254F1F24|nr:hypothetical protein [Corynebacterium sp. UMB10321]MDK8243561.1 hypothetical protein [Corynebacterium sp. UMB10321]
MNGNFYYNPTTGEITEGKEQSWENRMGPYKTREEAEDALRIAAARNQQADAEDAAEDNWGTPPSWEK